MNGQTKETKLRESLAREAIDSLEGQNWNDTPLTRQERLLVDLTVGYVLERLRERRPVWPLWFALGYVFGMLGAWLVVYLLWRS